MKVRLVEPIEKKLIAILKNGDQKDVGKFPLEIEDFDTARNMLGIDEEKFFKEHGELIQWSIEFVYDTPSGELEAGCMYWAWWFPEGMIWDNHKGAYLIVVLPNGEHWNIDSRSSECTMEADKTHRCWCRHGEAPNITVDKDGHTCGAGTGEIQLGNCRGFLRNGILTEDIN